MTKEQEAFNKGFAACEQRIITWLRYLATTYGSAPTAAPLPKAAAARVRVKALEAAADGIGAGEHMETSGEPT